MELFPFRELLENEKEALPALQSFHSILSFHPNSVRSPIITALLIHHIQSPQARLSFQLICTKLRALSTKIPQILFFFKNLHMSQMALLGLFNKEDFYEEIRLLDSYFEPVRDFRNTLKNLSRDFNCQIILYSDTGEKTTISEYIFLCPAIFNFVCIESPDEFCLHLLGYGQNDKFFFGVSEKERIRLILRNLCWKYFSFNDPNERKKRMDKSESQIHSLNVGFEEEEEKNQVLKLVHEKPEGPCSVPDIYSTIPAHPDKKIKKTHKTTDPGPESFDLIPQNDLPSFDIYEKYSKKFHHISENHEKIENNLKFIQKSLRISHFTVLKPQKPSPSKFDFFPKTSYFLPVSKLNQDHIGSLLLVKNPQTIQIRKVPSKFVPSIPNSQHIQKDAQNPVPSTCVKFSRKLSNKEISEFQITSSNN